MMNQLDAFFSTFMELNARNSVYHFLSRIFIYMHICVYMYIYVRREREKDSPTLQYILLGFLGSISVYTFMATFEKSIF